MFTMKEWEFIEFLSLFVKAKENTDDTAAFGIKETPMM